MTYLYLLATAGPRQALWIAGLAARDWKQRICGALNDEALKGAPAPLDERVAHLRALGQHLGYQARDAVKQVLRLAPADAALARAVDRICADLQHFAGRESQEMVELASALSGQAAPSPPEPPRYGEASRQGAIVHIFDVRTKRTARRRYERGIVANRWVLALHSALIRGIISTHS